jgi:hypothetical protein
MGVRLVVSRVETFFNGSWATVVSSGDYGDPDGERFADVVCRQVSSLVWFASDRLRLVGQMGLGAGRFLPATAVYAGDLFGKAVYMPVCSGNETKLFNCAPTSLAFGTEHTLDVGVECELAPPPAVLSSLQEPLCSLGVRNGSLGLESVTNAADRDVEAQVDPLLAAYLANNRSVPYCGAAARAYFLRGNQTGSAAMAEYQQKLSVRQRWSTAGTVLSIVFVVVVLLVPPLDLCCALRNERRQRRRSRVHPEPGAELAVVSEAASQPSPGDPLAATPAVKTRASAADVWTFVGPKGLAFAAIEASLCSCG